VLLLKNPSVLQTEQVWSVFRYKPLSQVRQLIADVMQDLQFGSHGEHFPKPSRKYPTCVLQSMQMCLPPVVGNNPNKLFEHESQLVLMDEQPVHDVSHGVQNRVLGSMNELGVELHCTHWLMSVESLE
jgi:hypothetical protein